MGVPPQRALAHTQPNDSGRVRRRRGGHGHRRRSATRLCANMGKQVAVVTVLYQAEFESAQVAGPNAAPALRHVLPPPIVLR